MDGQCVKFPATVGYLKLPSLNFGEHPALSFSVWFKASGASGASARILDIGSVSDNHHIIMSQLGNTSKMLFSVQRSNSDSSVYHSPNGTWLPDLWRHVVWTFVPKTALRDIATWRIYMDQTLLTVFDGYYPANQNFTSAFIGKSNYANDGAFVGYIDSLMVFSIPLTQNEVRILAAVSSFTPSMSHQRMICELSFRNSDNVRGSFIHIF